MTRTVDLTRELPALYRASVRPALVDVPERLFLGIDGAGSPDSPDFQDAVGALYALAYTTKFGLRKAGSDDFKVAPLEGLYDNGSREEFRLDDRERLRWTLLIPIPDAFPLEVVEAARREASSKKNLPALDRVRIERFTEGQTAQVLHVGPYAAEPATVALLSEFIRAGGFAARGRHHEIYLGDPRRSAPEKLRTIIRQPIV